jgi:large subunit ribosomal protein L4e
MVNADVARIINSDEVQSVVRPQKAAGARRTAKKNPLNNLQQLFKMNPYAKSFKRRETLFSMARAQARAEKAAAKRA